MYKLEVIAFNISCCIQIMEAGAHRIELCANPLEGGTTPSPAFIAAARRKVAIELFPIIRPRGGNFYYSDDEYDLIREDVLFCRNAGCDGVVTGMLQRNGEVDQARISEIVDLAYPMEVTFHRAFDRTPDATKALEQIIDAGCKRILTSGLQQTAMEGLDQISELVRQASGRVIIMPGSGIRSSNISAVERCTKAVEFHSSARIISADNMLYNNANLQESPGHAVVDQGEVISMLRVINEFNNGNV